MLVEWSSSRIQRGKISYQETVTRPFFFFLFPVNSEKSNLPRFASHRFKFFYYSLSELIEAFNFCSVQFF